MTVWRLADDRSQFREAELTGGGTPHSTLQLHKDR
jgi:hypothetical protein